MVMALAHCVLRLALASLPLLASALPLAYTPVPHGVHVALPSGWSAVLAVEGLTALRFSLVNGSGAPEPTATSMVAPQQQYASFTVSQSGAVVNLTAPGVGSLSLDASTGALSLADARGQLLTSTTGAPQQAQVQWLPYIAPAHEGAIVAAGGGRNDTCSAPRVAGDVSHGKRAALFPQGLAGATLDSCCAACNSDSTCIAWVWADAQHPDPTGKNCWPLSGFSGTEAREGRVLGGYAPPPPPLPPIASSVLTFATAPGARFLGSGTDGFKALTLSRNSTQALVGNTASWTPSFFCSGGWGLLAVSPYPSTAAGSGAASSQYPVRWQALKGGSGVAVTVLGGAPLPVDLYLYPAPTLKAFVAAQSSLQGRAAVPPRYALGFIACRWGWTNASYIEGVLREFRAGGYPLDAFVSDFEFFTVRPDYTLPPAGDVNYHDFGFSNVTFPAPAQQLAHYHADLHVRFGGIRKPRLGNAPLLVMARAKGWLMGQGGNASAPPDGTRNLNFSLPAAAAWYAPQNDGYLAAGVDFFWNDEADTGADYFSFTDWSRAQAAGLAARDAQRRFFSINRAFAPGAARLGATVWTGDIHPKWADLANTPGYVLNWGLAGQPWVACDIGGFHGESNALLLARWYAVDVFMPIMRIHSILSSTPHFPFPELWGAEASRAMLALLQLRYALLPYTYSLAHAVRAAGLPLARPMAMEFPDDPALAETTSQWMLGEGLLAAPVLGEGNASAPYLPAGLWFEWGSAVTHQGPVQLQLASVPLAAVPVYARAGAIVPLAPPLQYSDALPGGALSVAVYAGADGAFTLYEDDGETLAYANEGAPAVSTLALAWAQATRCLSWVQGGAVPNAAGARAFVALEANVYLPDGTQQRIAEQAIGGGGKACL